MPNYIISFLEAKMKGSTSTIVFLLFTLCTYAVAGNYHQAGTNLAKDLEDCVQECEYSETRNKCVEDCETQYAYKMAFGG